MFLGFLTCGCTMLLCKYRAILSVELTFSYKVESLVNTLRLNKKIT